MNTLDIIAILFPAFAAIVVLTTGFVEVWLDERAERKARQAPGTR
jgi:hypothetical protein